MVGSKVISLIPHIAAITSLVLWLVFLLLLAFLSFHEPEPPIVYVDSGKVDARAKSGTMVNITRTYRIDFSTPIRITRSLVSGDCATGCRVYEMPETAVLNDKVGVYHQTRLVRLPDVPAGSYRLVFTARWRNWLGREHQVKVPELTIQVTE